MELIFFWYRFVFVCSQSVLYSTTKQYPGAVIMRLVRGKELKKNEKNFRKENFQLQR